MPLQPNRSLKLKYRNPDYRHRYDPQIYHDPPEGTLFWNAERRKPNPGAPGNGRGATIDKGNKKKTIRPRKRAYGPF